MYQSALAQNINRIEEEAVLDAERKQKVKQLIEERQAEEEKIRNSQFTEEELRERNLVEVEPNNILPSDLSSQGALVPYKVRRPRWGLETGVAYSTFHPSSYSSTFVSPAIQSFDSVFGEDPMLEFYMNYKFNFSLGSLGLVGSYGSYSNEADDISNGTPTLDISMIQLSAKYIVDNVFFEPKIAPYAGVGMYVAKYSEEENGNENGGNTAPAPYYYFGALFQLDWLDQAAAVDAYTESGIENTFLFLEARQYLASSEAADPDFSTDFNLAGGISLEF